MATIEDVARITRELPGVSEGERGGGGREWSVAGEVFAWERAFSKADLRRFGDETPPEGPILAVGVEDLHEKEAVLAAHPVAFFTIPHFDGFSAVLIQVFLASEAELREVLADGWLTRAPADLVQRHLGG